jgi:hypothetical protein
MTRGPRATLGIPVGIQLDKPRRPEQLAHDDAAIKVRSHVVQCLTEHLRAIAV